MVRLELKKKFQKEVFDRYRITEDDIKIEMVKEIIDSKFVNTFFKFNIYPEDEYVTFHLIYDPLIKIDDFLEWVLKKGFRYRNSNWVKLDLEKGNHQYKTTDYLLKEYLDNNIKPK